MNGGMAVATPESPGIRYRSPAASSRWRTCSTRSRSSVPTRTRGRLTMRSGRSTGSAGTSSIRSWWTGFCGSSSGASPHLRPSSNEAVMHTRAKDIAEWLKDRVSAAGSRGIVVGLSGGIDSAVVVGLAAMAMPGRVVGVMLPCHSDPQDGIDAKIAADHFKVPAVTIDLAPAYDSLLSDLRKAVSTLPREQQPGCDRRRGRHTDARPGRQCEATAADDVALFRRQLAQLPGRRYRQS